MSVFYVFSTRCCAEEEKSLFSLGYLSQIIWSTCTQECRRLLSTVVESLWSLGIYSKYYSAKQYRCTANVKPSRWVHWGSLIGCRLLAAAAWKRHAKPEEETTSTTWGWCGRNFSRNLIIHNGAPCTTFPLSLDRSFEFSCVNKIDHYFYLKIFYFGYARLIN